MSEAHIMVHARLAELDAAAWDACAGTDNPFVCHAFLSALEDSGSAVARTGWQPQHLALHHAEGGVRAVLPLYLKGHSQGEYVFDHAWADAYARAGGRYYPKLISCVPFTPATGPRLLLADRDDHTAADALVAASVEVAGRLGVSSMHATFLAAEEHPVWQDQGFLLRTDQQFHWEDAGYGSFEGFLDSLASRKRKQIRKERRDALESGVTIRWLSGDELTEADWDTFYAFYLDTGNRKWGRPYLTRSFFSLIGERMADRVVLMLCRRDGRDIAGALNFKGETTLFGRYWGCVEDHRFLHFETCYYQAIDYALAHGLTRVEAGAQGPHKLARGYAPTTTYSVHWLADPGFHDAVARYLEDEREAVAAESQALLDYTPFKKGH